LLRPERAGQALMIDRISIRIQGRFQGRFQPNEKKYEPFYIKIQQKK
jgi:hypothetical protein